MTDKFLKNVMDCNQTVYHSIDTIDWIEDLIKEYLNADTPTIRKMRIIYVMFNNFTITEVALLIDCLKEQKS